MTKSALQYLITGWGLYILGVVLFSRDNVALSIVALLAGAGCFIKSKKEMSDEE